METPAYICKLEATDDVDSKSPADFHEQLQKMNFSHNKSSKNINRTFKSKPTKKGTSAFRLFWRKKPLMRCHHCPFKSYYPASYRRHVIMHSKITKVTSFEQLCKHCSATFFDQTIYQAHLSSHADSPICGKFRCHLCFYSSPRRSTLINHEATVHDLDCKGNPLPMGAFWCQECDFTCAIEPALNKHIDELHPGRFTSYKQKHKCTNCSFVTNYRFVLERHKRAHLPPGDSCPNTVCGIETANEDSNPKHMKKHEVKGASKRDKVAVKPQKRPTTKYHKKSTKLVERHRVKHSKSKLYPCPFCPGQFTYKYNMGIHVENVHKKSRAIAYASVDNPDVESNDQRATSSDARKNATTICILKQDSLLESNLEDNLTFACSLCSFTSSVQAEARLHCQLAHDKKQFVPYECSICNTITKYIGEMVRHLREHLQKNATTICILKQDSLESNLEDNLTFLCSLCSFASSAQAEARLHCKQAHNKQQFVPYECSICKTVTKYIGEMVRHMREHLPKNATTICVLKQDSLLESNLEDNLSFECSLCSFTSSVREEARLHCQLAHNKKQFVPYECSICETTTKYISEMVRHLREHLIDNGN